MKKSGLFPIPLLICFLITSGIQSQDEGPPEQIIIGGLFEHEATSNPQNYTDEIAFHLAIDHVNSNPDILPYTLLKAVTNSSQSLLSAFDNIQNACYQISKKVSVIVGPLSSSVVKSVNAISDGLHVPHVAPMATDPTLSLSTDTYKYLVKMSAPDSMQSRALLDLVRRFSWTKVAILTSLSDYGINGLQSFQTMSSKFDVSVLTVERFSPGENLDARKALDRIRDEGVRVIILNCLSTHAKQVLEQARDKKMTDKGWAWIITDGITSVKGLYDECLDTPPRHLFGLIGTRPAVGQGALYHKVAKILNGDASVSEKNTCSPDVEAYRIYDSVMAIAYGLHDYLSEFPNNYTHPKYNLKTCTKGDAEPWPLGERIVDYIKNSKGNGTMNFISFNDYATPDETKYDIVNLGEGGFYKIGSWEGNSEIYLDPLKTIIYPGNTEDKPDDFTRDMSNITLKVTTILEPPFVMLKNDTESGDIPYDGLCIELLKELQKYMKFKYEIHTVFDGQYGAPVEGSKKNSSGGEKWNGMVGELMNGIADVAVAPFTISYERQKVISFTQPYVDLGLTILIKIEEPESKLMAFLAPFSNNLWIAVILCMFFVGILMTICSTFSPYGYFGAYAQRQDIDDDSGYEERNAMNIYNGIWFSFASFAGQGADTNPRSMCGRLIGGMWWIAVLVIVANYTANLAAFLTVSRMDSGINSVDDLAEQSKMPYGTVEASQPASYFENSESDTFITMHKFMESRVTNVEDAESGIAKVRRENYAFIFDSAVLDYAVTQPPCNLQTVGRLFGKIGYGLGFPFASPYQEYFNEEVLKLRQEGFVEKIITRYFSGECDASTATTGSTQMGFDNMAGVFYCLFAGFGLGLVSLICECFYASYKETKSKKSTKTTFCGALGRRITQTNKHMCGPRRSHVEENNKMPEYLGDSNERQRMNPNPYTSPSDFSRRNNANNEEAAPRPLELGSFKGSPGPARYSGNRYGNYT